ncbi:MAG TPA: hypothetical protein VIJ46_00325 [Rhabdochlamydiaceae bacterium]
MKKILFSSVALLSLQGSAFGLTIINQTDAEKILQVQEAKRPPADKSGNVEFPASIGCEPYEIAVPAHSAVMMELREACPVLLIGVVTTEVTMDADGEIESTSTSTTCYEPYGYQGQEETHFSDDWGIVIHKPLPMPQIRGGFDSSYFSKLYFAKRNLEQGYGIKCVHPILLGKVTSLEELPEELTK